MVLLLVVLLMVLLLLQLVLMLRVMLLLTTRRRVLIAVGEDAALRHRRAVYPTGLHLRVRVVPVAAARVHRLLLRLQPAVLVHVGPHQRQSEVGHDDAAAVLH